MSNSVALETVKSYFMTLQDGICAALERLDGQAVFSREVTETPGPGLARPRVMAEGQHIEKAAVQFTHSVGAGLPPAATERHPHLAGSPFQAVAISLIVHPRNPYVPTTHMNLRFFYVAHETPHWHFGGGYDLTPCYAQLEDVQHWHRCAAQASGEYYEQFKQQCDEYFYLPHRDEQRGVGGLFFDDWVTGGFDAALGLTQSIGDSFLGAYEPIFKRRQHQPYDAQQREFQLYRRGRYAEFNLAFDRGTKYGLQSGRRVESVLASLPPLVRWEYNRIEHPGSPEAQLTEFFLRPQDWLNL